MNKKEKKVKKVTPKQSENRHFKYTYKLLLTPMVDTSMQSKEFI
jgi:hypothetical protein